jgi:hypothetical protein
MIDKMVTQIDTKFIDNQDMKGFAVAEELFLTANVSSEYLLTKCEQTATIFNDIDPANLAQELGVLNRCRHSGQTEIPTFCDINEFIQFLKSQHRVFNAMFPEMMKLGSLLLVIPATSATAERSFSCLKRVKTWLRSSMTQTRLNSVALLHAHRNIQPDLELVMKEFIDLNNNRRLIFGNKTNTLL